MKTIIPVALIWLLLVLGCGNIVKRNFASFDPYKGGLSELLQSEISGGLAKFKLSGTRDSLANFAGATEAKGFTYIQEGAGVSVPIDGALVNYPSAATANEELKKIAADYKTTVAAKSKGTRFSANDGKVVGWTNGSLLCFLKSGFAKPAGNLEDAAPF